MKKSILLSLSVAVIALSYFVISCQHHIPCDELNFHISTTHTDATWNQQDGSITATATGGNGFEFSINSGSFGTSGVFNNLGAGTYIVKAKNSSGCEDQDTVIIGGGTNPCSGAAITLTETHTDPTTGQSNGSIIITANPTGTYTYSINSGSFQSSNTFTGLATGVYNIIAQNSTGCTSAPIQVNLGSVNPCAGVNIVVTTTFVSPTTGQSNGSITANATPADTYTYSINGGVYQSGNVFSNLAAGSYTISAKNSNGCTGSTTINLTANNPCSGVTINLTTTPTNPTNGANGSISASASGGLAPYTYSISGGAYSSNSTFSALSSGSYTISAKDANGCTGTAVTVSLACPPIIVTGTPASSKPNCPNNTIAVAASNGVSPYTYSKDGTNFQTSANIFPLAGGTYTITAKDSKGCTGSSTVTVSAPATVHFSTDVKPTINTYCGRSNVSCHSHADSWTTYSDIVGSSTGDAWSSNLLTFIRRVRGTSTTTNCVYSTGNHDMPPTSSTTWTTFIQGVFTNWVNQGYPNN